MLGRPRVDRFSDRRIPRWTRLLRGFDLPINLDSPIGRPARRRCGSARSIRDGSWTSSPPFGFYGGVVSEISALGVLFDILTVGKEKIVPFFRVANRKIATVAIESDSVPSRSPTCRSGAPPFGSTERQP